MAILDCTCKGVNPNCEKCFGRGYYDDEKQNIDRIPFKTHRPDERVEEQKTPLKEKLAEYSDHQIYRLIDLSYKEIEACEKTISNTRKSNTRKRKHLTKRKKRLRNRKIEEETKIYKLLIQEQKEKLDMIQQIKPEFQEYISSKHAKMDKKHHK